MPVCRLLAGGIVLTMTGISAVVAAQEESPSPPGLVRSAVMRTTGFNDDPALIRPSELADGYGTWLHEDDFPQDWYPTAIGMANTANLLLQIGADDQLSACINQSSSLQASSIAERACELILQRGRFHHGIDESGQAHPGERQVTVRLQVHRILVSDRLVPPPSPPPAPPGLPNPLPVLLDAGGKMLPQDISSTLNRPPTLSLDVSALGQVTRCRITTTTGSDAGDVALCRHAAGLQFEPGHSANGQPVAFTSLYFPLQVPK